MTLLHIRNSLTLVAAVALLALEPGPAQAQGYAFTTLVDSSQGFDPFGFGCPALNDSGQVAFKALTDGSVEVIVRADDDGLTTIADDTGKITVLGVNPSINTQGEVSFAARLKKGDEAIFLGQGGGLKRIAGTAPGDFNFFGFNTSVNDRSQVAFKAELDEAFNSDEGLFVGNGSKVTTIYLASTSQFLGDDSRPSINDVGQIAFEESLDDSTRGIFLFSGGAFITIVDGTSPVVDAAVNPQVNNAGVVAFHAFLDSDGEAILTGSGGPLTTVADTTGPFAFFDSFGGPSINDSGVVAFGATLDTGESGIFIGPEPVADRVIQTGDSLGGSVVTNTVFCREGLNNVGQLAFQAQLEDGRTLIVRATPLP